MKFQTRSRLSCFCRPIELILHQPRHTHIRPHYTFTGPPQAKAIPHGGHLLAQLPAQLRANRQLCYWHGGPLPGGEGPVQPAGSAPLSSTAAAAKAGAFSFPRPAPAGLQPTARLDPNPRPCPGAHTRVLCDTCMPCFAWQSCCLQRGILVSMLPGPRRGA